MKRSSFARKALLWGAVLLTLALLVGAAWSYAARERPRPVATAPARIGDIELSVLATGTLEPVQQVSVGAQVSGQIKSLAVVLGQQVKKGDLVAEIDSLPQRNALRQAEAGVTNLQAQRSARQAALAQARLAFKRQEQMLAQDATSREAFETAQTTLESAEAEVAALAAQLAQAKVAADTARLNLGYTRITAPIDGKVVAIVTLEGQTVNASQSAPTIVVLARLDTLTVKAEISEADVAKVQPGQPVYFTTLGDPGRRYQATLRQVEPAPTTYGSEASSGSNASSTSTAQAAGAVYYYGLFDVANAEGRLRIGMTAQVHIVLGSAARVLTVPSAALESVADGSATVRVQGEDGSISARVVQIGLADSARAQVMTGLREGERVVVAEASATPADAMPRRRSRGGLF